MVERALGLLVDQVVKFMSKSTAGHIRADGLETNETAQWALKVGKVFKALKLMETHKASEPKFSRTLKPLYPHLRRSLKTRADPNLIEEHTDEEELNDDQGSFSIGNFNLDGSITPGSPKLDGISLDKDHS